MSDTALKNAESKRKQLLDRKAALRAELSKVDKALDTVELFIASWHQFAGDKSEGSEQDIARFAQELVRNVSGTRESIPNDSEAPFSARARNSKKEEVAEAARKIIELYGRPVSRSELFTELISRGFTIQGKDPEMVLSTMLWRMQERVVRLKSGGYWLADVPYEEAGYYGRYQQTIFD